MNLYTNKEENVNIFELFKFVIVLLKNMTSLLVLQKEQYSQYIVIRYAHIQYTNKRS